MKLNYRDRIILLIVLAIAILAVGFFAAVRPLTKSIKENKKQCDEVQKEWEAMDAEIKKIPGLQDKINALYDDSIKLCGDFVEQNEHSYEIDKQLQKYADDCNLTIKELAVNEPGESALSYYFEEPVLLQGSMYEAADINGNYAMKYIEDNAAALALQERTSETIIMQEYEILANGSKKEIWDYMKAIADIKKSVIITSVDINDYYFGIDKHSSKELEWTEDPEDTLEPKRLIPTNATENPDSKVKEGYSDVIIHVNVYSVIPLDKPIVE